MQPPLYGTASRIILGLKTASLILKVLFSPGLDRNVATQRADSFFSFGFKVFFFHFWVQVYFMPRDFVPS